MSKQDLSFTLLTDKTPDEVFNAVNNVRGWWSESLKGDTHNVNDVFTYRHKDMHETTQRLTEVVPGKRVVWLVIEGSLNFIENKREWVGTKIVFDISKQGDKTQLVFTHVGLVPGMECYEACFGGWSLYIKESLASLINTGKGKPDRSGSAKAKSQA